MRSDRMDDFEEKKSADKKKKIIAAVVAVVVLAAGGYLLYQKVFKPTTIDLSAVMTEPEITGVSGAAKLKEPITVDQKKADELIKSIDNEERAEAAKKLIKSVTYKADKNSNLSNGDEITITAKYDQSIAENNKLEVVNTETKIKVEKLSDELTVADIKNSGIIKTLEAEFKKDKEECTPQEWLYCKTDKGNIIAVIAYADFEGGDTDRIWTVGNSSTFDKSLNGVHMATWESLGKIEADSYDAALQKLKSACKSVEVIK